MRIDLWGDEVDRLSEFTLTDQRSTADIEVCRAFPCRELLPTDEVQNRASKLISQQPWGREQWERLSEGQIFDGMESWLPWLTEDEHVLTDLLPANGQVLLLDPRRMHDRARELLDEEASLASSLATTWGLAADQRFPQLHVEVDRLLAKTKAPVRMVTNAPEGPDTAVINVSSWAPVVGDGSKVAKQIIDLTGKGFSVIITADGKASAQRMSAALAEEGVDAPYEPDPDMNLKTPGAKIIVAGMERGFIFPARRLLCLPKPMCRGVVELTVRSVPASALALPFMVTCSRATTSFITITALVNTPAWCSAPSAAPTKTICCSNTRVATSFTYRLIRSTPFVLIPVAKRRRCTSWAARTSVRQRPACAALCAILPPSWLCFIKSARTRLVTLSAKTRPGSAN